MMRRTALLVAVLAAAGLAFVPSAPADPILERVEIPQLGPGGESLIPRLNATGHAEAELAPLVRVAGGTSVAVGPEESAVPVQGDSAVPAQGDDAADRTSVATDVGAAGPERSIAAATAAVGLLAVLAFGFETVRAAASNLWTHVARIVRGTVHLAVLLPLFSRISRADLLENPVRASIHAAVMENPGLSLTEVKSRTGIAWGTAVHHLQRLESHGMVVSATERAHRRYFVAGSPAALRRNDIAVMTHPTAHRIAALVSGQPGIDQTGICRALGLNNPAASKHLRGFEAQGLVLSQRDGRKRLYHSTPSMAAALPFVQGKHIAGAVPIPQRAVPTGRAVESG